MSEPVTSRRFLEHARRALRRGWQLLREISGDDAYERYVEHCRRHRPGETPPDRDAFLAARTAGKWNGIARCC